MSAVEAYKQDGGFTANHANPLIAAKLPPPVIALALCSTGQTVLEWK